MGDKILRLSKTLGDETRLKIYRWLTARVHPATVTEVAAEFALHPNAARSHLTQLEEAGLALSGLDHHAGSGRPPRVYRAAGLGMTPVFEPSAFRALAVMLLELLAEQEGLDETRLAAWGERWGRSYAARWRTPPATTTPSTSAPGPNSIPALTPAYILIGLHRTLQGWGFVAEPEGPDDSPAAVVVRRCAYADLVGNHHGRICPLIHGVLNGMLATVRPDLTFRLTHQGAALGTCCRIDLGEPPAGEQ